MFLTIATTSNASFIKMINTKADTNIITAIEGLSNPLTKNSEVTQALNAVSGTDTKTMFFGNTSGNVYVNSTPKASGGTNFFFTPSSTNEVTNTPSFLSATEWTPLADTVALGESFVQSRNVTSEKTSLIRSGFSWVSSVETQVVPEFRDSVGTMETLSASVFKLAPNGVTITCNGAIAGDTGVVNGVTYTAVTNTDLSDAIGSTDPVFYETACTSLVTDINVSGDWGGSVFYNSTLSPDISHWDVSSVTSMNRMFYGSAFNSDISGWDVSSVTDMTSIFGVSAFNRDISGWDVSSVTNMSSMFYESAFNSDISGWDVSSVTNVYMMFGKSVFNSDISGWCVPQITTKPSWFDYAAGFSGQTALQPQWGTCPI